MNDFGMNYQINKQRTPKTGLIPPIDIESVEKTIGELELELETNTDREHIEYLMDLYAKVY